MVLRNAYYTVASNNINTTTSTAVACYLWGTSWVVRMEFRTPPFPESHSIYHFPCLCFPRSFHSFIRFAPSETDCTKEPKTKRYLCTKDDDDGMGIMMIMLLASGMHCFSFPPDIAILPSDWMTAVLVLSNSRPLHTSQSPSWALSCLHHLPCCHFGIFNSSCTAEVLLLTVTGNESCGASRPLFLPVHCLLSLLVFECLALQLCPTRLHNNSLWADDVPEGKEKDVLLRENKHLWPPPVTMMTTMAVWWEYKFNWI